MFSIRNQLICLAIAMLLVVCLQPDAVNGQMKKKKAILKGLMGAGLLKTLFKSKKGVLPIPLPLPLPLPIDWHTQAGLLSKNQQPSHVSHQPYPQSGIQMSPIEFSEYQNAISQAMSSGNSYIPSSYGGSSSYGSGQAGGQSENSGYGSQNGAPSNGYDGSSGSGDENSNGYNSNSGPTSYGVAGVNQNDEYNAYQVSNNDQGSSGGYRAAASSNYNNVHYGQQGGYGQYPGNQYSQNQYNNNNQYNAPSEQYSQPAPQNNEPQQQQYGYQQNGQSSNYEDNSGSASSNSYVATSGQQQQSSNNYIPLRSVPIYHHHVQTNQYQANGQASPNYASNGWVALD